MQDSKDIISNELPCVKSYAQGNLSNAIAHFRNPEKFEVVKAEPVKDTLSSVVRINNQLDKRIEKTGKLTEQFLCRKLLRLPDSYREMVRNHLRTTHFDKDSVALLLSQWDYVLSVTNASGAWSTKYSKRKAIWDTIESSVPVILGTDFWYVRILFNRIEKKKYIDIRQWKQNDAGQYEPTMTGYCVPIDSQLKLLYVIQKLLTKHKG